LNWNSALKLELVEVEASSNNKNNSGATSGLFPAVLTDIGA
jgi:hypothetical protein